MGLIFSVPSLALKPSLSSAAILLRRRKKCEECGPAPLIDYDVRAPYPSDFVYSGTTRRSPLLELKGINLSLRDDE